jgi:hypothetical protein
MTIECIIFFILGIFLVIFSILVLNHYRLHPEKEGGTATCLTLFIIGIIVFLGSITEYFGFLMLALLLFGLIMSIYNRYTLNKNPEKRKIHEKNKELLKKHPIYKWFKITEYLALICAIMGAFVLAIILFNIRF